MKKLLVSSIILILATAANAQECKSVIEVSKMLGKNKINEAISLSKGTAYEALFQSKVMSKNPKTILLPNDTAFDDVKTGITKKLMKDKNLREKVLSYHVIDIPALSLKELRELEKGYTFTMEKNASDAQELSQFQKSLVNDDWRYQFSNFRTFDGTSKDGRLEPLVVQTGNSTFKGNASGANAVFLSNEIKTCLGSVYIIDMTIDKVTFQYRETELF